MGTTVRVEEDLYIVDQAVRAPAPCADEIVARLGDLARFSALRDADRLISRTSPHPGLTGLLAELRRNRSLVAQAAGQVDGDCAPLAAGVVPWARRGVHSTGGLRVTVQCSDGSSDGGGDVLAVCRGVSRHLPALLAISASSPLDDEGVDTGYASSRALQAPRWPASGAYPEAATMDDYRRDVEFLQHTRVITGPEMMHYDVRPARQVTDGDATDGVEIRLCDACSSSATVGVIVALCRALVSRENTLVQRGTPTPPLPVLQQRTATWRAARSGMEGELLDPSDLELKPAEDVIVALVELLADELGDDGGWVRDTVGHLLRAGSGAYRQRRTLRRRGRTDDVVGLLIAETLDTVGLEDATPRTPLGLSAYEPSVVDDLGEAFWDEAVDATGTPRPVSAPALSTMVQTGALRLRSRLRASEEELTGRGITFRASGTDRHLVFPIDPVPRIITESTWDTLSAGVEQRMRAINAFLDDIYGDREIVRAGVVDLATLERAPGFRRVGRHTPPGRVRNHINGADLVCSDDGRWQVLEDNVRMPSGLTFALAARDVTCHHFPEMLDATEREFGEVIDPAGSLETMCTTLRAAAPPGVDPEHAHVIVASAGEEDSTFAEQSLIAGVGGFSVCTTDQILVDADDDGTPTLWDVSRTRRRRVDVVYMRMEEEMFLSSTGADGTVLREPFQAVLAAGTVAVANALGNGVADDKAIYAHVPAMIDFYLGERPALDQVTTYLCSVREQRDKVLDRLGELVVKPIDGYGGAGITVGPECTEAQLAARRRELLTHPDQFIAQEVVRLSTLPTFDGLGIQRRHVDLRMFSHLRQPGGPGTEVDALTVPAGLTRVAPAGSMIVNSSRGGGGKDTWILRGRQRSG
ncbi:Glutamate-cysteine ligase, Gcs2 [Corynebacterium glyciniphilum AJ 3170]|uniref:Glutamate-cysteine ligase, Gcs2 n=1 Tax=Corynebacterium glyciniphilum AJ 3170 TaxID=1404245 RepID=X5E9H8_9CORY|nr:carboxylate--amine ligase/circularly permuted type 2 ATP-grasp protein [Corynebacterium glyciniphilum]AHW63281.1 Glutamate-cysteine ligase, Gcs2 [Corynebacterium glyciniphilum AJ 3170]